ncbi:MAG: Rieske 2Fe-2S domain-containing protein [Thermoplasmata archaeon]|nr:Rieske 2Fe-2S domain-containing protein [Thermoplasmata archaeon]
MPTWRIPATPPPEPGHALRVLADATPVAVFNAGGALFAVDARCTHVGGPLDRGRVSEGIVTCPLHGSQFDLATGKVMHGPASNPLRAYRARVEAGSLVLEAD